LLIFIFFIREDRVVNLLLSSSAAPSVPAIFQLLLQPLDLFKRPGVDNGGGCVVGTHPHPDEFFVLQANARENGQNA
jgi:hypothetical protein